MLISQRRSITFSPSKARATIIDYSPSYVRNRLIPAQERLLSFIRYNRLIDVFLDVSAFSLQVHAKANLRNVGRIETDEIYYGISSTRREYVIPVHAKGGKDRIGAIQIEQDLALCRAKYPNLTPRPIAIQFIKDGDAEVIVMLELSDLDSDIKIEDERHYRLVPASEISVEELQALLSKK